MYCFGYSRRSKKREREREAVARRARGAGPQMEEFIKIMQKPI
jgi:hypothetical protein